jgi:hypothetical protein
MHPLRLALRREGTSLSEGEYGTSHPSISLMIMATYGACISTAEMSQVKALSYGPHAGCKFISPRVKWQPACQYIHQPIQPAFGNARWRREPKAGRPDDTFPFLSLRRQAVKVWRWKVTRTVKAVARRVSATMMLIPANI